MPKPNIRATCYTPFWPTVLGAVVCGVFGTAMGAFGNGVALLCGVALTGVVLGYVYAGVRRARVEHCSFCGQPNGEATAESTVVRGVAICERCAPRALAVALGEHDWIGVADALPARTPRAASSPMIEAMVARATSDDELRAANKRAWHMSNWAAAEIALSKIAEAARTPIDWIDLGIVLGRQRRYEDALALTRRAEIALMGRRADYASSVPIVAISIAWLSAKVACRNGGVVSRDDAARWLRALDEAGSTLEKIKNDPSWVNSTWEWWSMHCVGARADVLRVVGDLDGALASLESTAASYPQRLTYDFLLCRAHVHAARGANAEAASDLEAALRQLHPESEDAAEARELLEAGRR